MGWFLACCWSCFPRPGVLTRRRRSFVHRLHPIRIRNTRFLLLPVRTTRSRKWKSQDIRGLAVPVPCRRNHNPLAKQNFHGSSTRIQREARRHPRTKTADQGQHHAVTQNQRDAPIASISRITLPITNPQPHRVPTSTRGVPLTSY